MASVRLSLADLDQPLPEVCIVCGQNATMFKVRTFTWIPTWVWFTLLLGLLPLGIIAVFVARQAKLQTPLCHEHESHWSARLLVVWLGLLVLVVAAFACAVIGVGRTANWCWIGWGVCLAAWLIAIIVLSMTAVRAVSITDHHLTLTSVAPDFVETVKRWRPAPPDPRDYLGPYRLLPLTDENHDEVSQVNVEQNVQDKSRAPVAAERAANNDVSFQDKSRRAKPPDDRIRE